MSKHAMLTNCRHKLECTVSSRGSCWQQQLLLINNPCKRQFNDHRRICFTMHDDSAGHRNMTTVKNDINVSQFGGRMNQSVNKHLSVGGAGGDSAARGGGDLKLLATSIDAFAGFYKAANQMSLEKVEGAEEKRLSYLLGRSHFGLAMIGELMRNSFSVEEFVTAHETHLGSVPKIGIFMDGKDVSLLDSPTMMHALWLWHLEQLISFGDVFTREKLIALFYLIVHHMWNREPTYSLHYMRLFTSEYPKTKKLYTTILDNSLDKSWTNVLGRVFTENEFDNFNDLDSELPVNLKSMFNIFSAFVSYANSDNVPVDVYLKRLDEETVKNPLHPYIPYMKVMMEDQFEEIDNVLKILEHGKSLNQSCFENKRLECGSIFSNSKPDNVKKIKDFRFFPVMYWKACSLSEHTTKQEITELRKCVEQLEFFSGMPSHCKLLNLKMVDEFNHKHYERVLEIYKFTEKHFHSQIKFDDDYCLTFYGCSEIGKKR